MHISKETQQIYLRRMVSDCLVERGVRRPEILRAFMKIPRHLFVSEALRHQAYAATSLPIGQGQTISHPYTVGRMTELLSPSPGHSLLEIGTGSGYQTAILALLAGRVTTVERLPELSGRARRLLDHLGIDNVEYHVGDGSVPAFLGDGRRSFDGIIVTCAAPHVPTGLVDLLVTGGRIVLPLGEGGQQKLYIGHKTVEGLNLVPAGRARFVPFVEQGRAASL